MARSSEGHMDWEPQGPRPVDLTSPFTQYVQSQKKGQQQHYFGSPKKTNPNNNSRGIFSTSPTKPLPPIPQGPFSPKIAGPAARQFRNPAFTTPRKPVDDVIFSEASGAETSPAVTENDTPDVDRMSDVSMGGITLSSRVDKTQRYGRHAGAGSVRKHHAPGRGEIPRGGGGGGGDTLRKRKRMIFDRDVRSARRRQGLGDFVESESSEYSDSDEADALAPYGGKGKRGRGSSRKADHQTWLGGVFAAADHPEFPSRAIGLLKVLLAAVLLFVAFITGYSTIITIKTDIQQANDQARTAMFNRIGECTKHYTANLCDQNLPALQAQCEEWRICMNDDPDVTFTIRNSFKELAKIINSFSGELHWKSWVFVFSFSALLLWFSVQGIAVLARSTTEVYFQGHHPPPSQPLFPPSHHGSVSAANWLAMETPRSQRSYQHHHMLENGSDTDEPPRSSFRRALPPPPQTPSGRRSPSKEERAMSPSKRSPSKRY